jgi:glucan biosynthesis protein C
MPALASVSNPRDSNRYYGFDALRASMLLLGILFHLAIPYTGVILPGYYVTDARSRLLQVVLVLHYFRMPVFFVLSGFFSALVWERGGTRKFLYNRLKRIGLVWLVSLAILSPFMVVVSTYTHFASRGGNALKLAWAAITSLQIDPNWLQLAPLHLWFLEYLMLFCVEAAMIVNLLQPLLPRLDSWAENVIGWRFRIIAFAIPTAATIWRMPLAVMPYPASFVPWLGISFAYGWFYAVGWLLFRRRDLLPLLASRAQTEKAAAPVLFVICFVLVKSRSGFGPEGGPPWLDIAVASTTALFIWATVIALIATFHQIKPAKWLPYLADSSYWMYLMHYPLAISLPAALGHWSISPVTKVGLCTAFIFVLLLLTYDQCIRYTVIGRALNGVRFRTLASPAPQSSWVCLGQDFTSR